MFLPALHGLGVSVCLSVTTITKTTVDGFVPNFMRRFLGEREDQVRVSLRSIEGCGSNSQKLRKPAIGYIFILLIVGVAIVAKCWRQNPPNFAFAGSCTLSEYFPSSFSVDSPLCMLIRNSLSLTLPA